MIKYDLYWYPYEYLSATEEPIKKRPVIIIDNHTVLPIAMEVTSHGPRSVEEGHWDYPIENWREAGLQVPSTAVTTEVNYISSSTIPDYDYIGHLTDFDIENLEIMLRTMPDELEPELPNLEDFR